jgi:Domain of unknown function (DUF4832)/Domain of unknown function (DUF4874)
MISLCKLFVVSGCILLLSGSHRIRLIESNSENNSSTISSNNSQNILTTYHPSDENFPNPERGFAVLSDPPWPPDLKIAWGFCNPSQENAKKYTYTDWTEPLDLTLLRSQRNQGKSLVMVRYHIAEFRYKPLSQKFLDRLENDFTTARKAGVKSVIHFAYNWPMGGPDAPIDKVLQHLNQLKPVLQKNVDVVAFMDAGFIGCWGEWHTSSNDLIGMDSSFTAIMNNNSRRIIDKIFEILPRERMVAVRYPRYKFDYFGSNDGKPISPLKASEAFNGSKKSRWGQEDDCLVCGEWNAGTYWSPRKKSAEIKNFLNQDNLYVVQTGEPGDIPTKSSELDLDGDGYKDNYNSCDRVLPLFRQMRWSTINGSYNLGSPTAANKRWQQDGCYDKIAKQLGYRFRLIESSIPLRVKAGGKLSMSFKITNDGWAAPYNPRRLEIILRNKKNGAIVRLSLKNDPRFWQPEKSYSVNIVNYPLPQNLAIGQYDLLLNLPDPTSNLKTRPEYSIRLANKDLWESKSGYNSFLRTVFIE